MKPRTHRLYMTYLVVAALVLFASQVTAQALFADLDGHWAAAEVNDWLTRGLAGGYSDGRFLPDKAITRAEFAAYMNRAFGLTQTAASNFSDVASDDWYAWDVSIAVAAGYMGGYPDGTFRPNQPIARDEAANTLTRYLKLAPSAELSTIAQFKDTIPDWSKYAVDAVVSAKLMGGMPGETFQATSSMTRAQAIVTLDRALKSRPVVTVFDQPGTYGPETGSQTIKGDVKITTADVSLRNTVITGNLTLAESIGEGNVYLKKVSVTGQTFVQGGGAHSIHFEDFEGDVTSSKAGVRLVVSGTTRVPHLRLENGAIIAEVDEDGDGIVDITISRELPANATVDLSGSFGSVQVAAPQAALTVSGGSVAQLQVTETATNTTLTLNGQAQIASLDLAAPANVSGDGRVEQTTINTTSAVLAGNFGAINVVSPLANVELTSGTVQTMGVTETAVGATLNVAATTQVTQLQLSAETRVTGQGQITSATVNTQQAVVLEGNFGTVGVAVPQANVQVASGSVGTLNLQQGATGTTIALGEQTRVQTLEVNATANVTGSGSIQNAVVRAPETVIQQQPTNVVADQGTTLNVGGQDRVGTGTGTVPKPGTTPPSSGGGPGGGDLTPTAPTIVSVSAINGTVTVVLSGVPSSAPVKTDFTVTEKLGDMSISRPVDDVAWNASAKTATLTVAPVWNGLTDLNMTYTVSYKGGAVSSVPFTVVAVPQPVILTWETDGKSADNNASVTVTAEENHIITLTAILQQRCNPVDNAVLVLKWTKGTQSVDAGDLTVKLGTNQVTETDGQYQLGEPHRMGNFALTQTSETYEVTVTFHHAGEYHLEAFVIRRD